METKKKRRTTKKCPAKGEVKKQRLFLLSMVFYEADVQISGLSIVPMVSKLNLESYGHGVVGMCLVGTDKEELQKLCPTAEVLEMELLPGRICADGKGRR